MIRRFAATPIGIGLLAAALAACGTEEPENNQGTDSPGPDTDTNTDADSDSEGDFSTDIYPMKVGAFWTYLETFDTGETKELTYTVTDKTTLPVGIDQVEREVFVVENTFDQLNERRIQFIEDDGTIAVRHSHEVYDIDEQLTKTRDYEPGFLRVDRTKTTIGQTWDHTVTRVSDTLDGRAPRAESVTYTFTVLDTNASVTVNGRTFSCYQFQRANNMDNEVKIYWHAPGVGKVKEFNGEKTEELIASSFFE